MAKIIDGKAVSASVKEAVAKEAAALKEKGILVGLAVVIVGNDPASRVYVNNKKKACAACGIESYEYALPEETTEEELLALVEKLNGDPAVNGILVQLPLPRQIDEHRIIEAISPKKDVDAFHAVNVGKIMIGDFDFLPCTPSGCMDLIDSTGVPVEGKRCVVIGRSNIVGKPMAMLLLHRNGTVPFQNKEPEGDLPRGGHSGRSGGPPQFRHGGYGKRRRCGHRRRHEPAGERQALRRRGF